MKPKFDTTTEYDLWVEEKQGEQIIKDRGGIEGGRNKSDSD